MVIRMDSILEANRSLLKSLERRAEALLLLPYFALGCLVMAAMIKLFVPSNIPKMDNIASLLFLAVAICLISIWLGIRLSIQADVRFQIRDESGAIRFTVLDNGSPNGYAIGYDRKLPVREAAVPIYPKRISVNMETSSKAVSLSLITDITDQAKLFNEHAGLSVEVFYQQALRSCLNSNERIKTTLAELSFEDKAGVVALENQILEAIASDPALKYRPRAVEINPA